MTKMTIFFPVILIIGVVLGLLTSAFITAGTLANVGEIARVFRPEARCHIWLWLTVANVILLMTAIVICIHKRSRVT